jgi:hypothetical protein
MPTRSSRNPKPNKRNNSTSIKKEEKDQISQHIIGTQPTKDRFELF